MYVNIYLASVFAATSLAAIALSVLDIRVFNHVSVSLNKKIPNQIFSTKMRTQWACHLNWKYLNLKLPQKLLSARFLYNEMQMSKRVI